jgi:hypothetical protein
VEVAQLTAKRPAGVVRCSLAMPMKPSLRASEVASIRLGRTAWSEFP